MISYTTEGLFIVYNNTFLQNKKCFSLMLGFLTLIYGPFSCLMIVLFGPICMENFVIFQMLAQF